MTKVFSVVYGKNLKYRNLCEKYRVVSIPFEMVWEFRAQYHIKYHIFPASKRNHYKELLNLIIIL